MIRIKHIGFLLFCSYSLLLVLINLAATVVTADVSALGNLCPQARQSGGGVPPTTTPVSITLTPGIGASLIYTDTQALPTLLDFPANAVTRTTTILLTPELLTSPRSDFIFAGHAFGLLAMQSGQLNKGFIFNAPVTVTITYSDKDVQKVPSEDQLILYWWSGFDWRDAASTCIPASAYSREPTHNRISIPICYPGAFGLFATYQIYIPVIRR